MQMNWINVVVVIVLTSFGIKFALDNMGPVFVHFMGYSTPQMHVYLPIFVAFLVGFCGGLLAMSFSRRKHKQVIEQLRRDNTNLQSEVDNLRNIPLQDDL